MSKIKKVLVAYSGSQDSEGIFTDLKYAGLPQGTEVMVLTVADVALPSHSERQSSQMPAGVVGTVKKIRLHVAQALRAAHQAALRGSRRLKNNCPHLKVRAHSLAGSPAWAILQEAAQWNADLIVVGTGAFSGARKFFLGSVSQLVLANAHCTVRIARQMKNKTPLRMIAGVDGSPDSKRALDFIGRRTWPKGSGVYLVTALDHKMASIIESRREFVKISGHEPINEKSWIHRWVSQKIENSIQTLGEAGLEVSFITKLGDPKNILLQEAKQRKANCIFIGAKGLSGIRKYLLGSVSSAVSSRAHCSVEVVR